MNPTVELVSSCDSRSFKMISEDSESFYFDPSAKSDMPLQVTVSHWNDRSSNTRKLRVPPYLSLRHCSRSHGVSMVTPCCRRAESDGTSTHDDCCPLNTPLNQFNPI
jgi:hypothetical protein